MARRVREPVVRKQFFRRQLARGARIVCEPKREHPPVTRLR